MNYSKLLLSLMRMPAVFGRMSFILNLLITSNSEKKKINTFMWRGSDDFGTFTLVVVKRVPGVKN